MDHHFVSASEKTAFLHHQGSLSYHDFVRKIGSLAEALPIEPGDRIILYGPNSIEWTVALYAIWRKGGVAVPLDFAAGIEDLIFMLRDADAKLALIHSEDRGHMEQARKEAQSETVLMYFDEAKTHKCSDSRIIEKSMDETAVILYTSGTTAEAKGVELSYRSLLFNIEAVRLSGMVLPEDRLLALFPFHHIVPLQGHILCPLKLGATVCMVEALNAEAIIRAFQSFRITVLNGVPQLYERFHTALMKKIDSSRIGRIVWFLAGLLPSQRLRKRLFSIVHQHFGGRIKYFLSGGAPLPKKIAEDFTRLGFTMIEGYGMTEMGPLISFNTPRENRLGTVGKAVAGVCLKIEGREVLTRGPGLMNGYFRRPDLTQKVMQDGWLRTGDLGQIDKDGFLSLTGRESDVLVMSSGKNINAPKIEAFLASSELILEAGLTIRFGRLFALIHPDMDEIRRQGILNLHEAIKWRLLDGYNRRCSAHERILDFGISTKPLPRTRLGKLKRHRLGSFIEPAAQAVDSESVTAIDSRIVSYLQEEGYSGLHPQAHLTVDLGLDSLAMIEFKRHLEIRYRLKLPDTLFIEYASLEELDRYLRDLEKKGEKTSPPPSQPKHKTLFSGGFRGWIRPLISLAGFPFRIRHEGLEHLENNGKPLIIVSNHQSFLDPLFILRVLPRKLSGKTYFMAKTRIFNSRIGRFILPRLNTVLLDLHQSGEELMKQSRSLLLQGKNLMIFPEGTRSYDGRLGPFSRAFAILARETGAQIVPLLIKGAYDLMPRTRLVPRFGKVDLTVLPPLSPPFPDAAALSDRVFDLFRQKLEE